MRGNHTTGGRQRLAVLAATALLAGGGAATLTVAATDHSAPPPQPAASATAAPVPRAPAPPGTPGTPNPATPGTSSPGPPNADTPPVSTLPASLPVELDIPSIDVHSRLLHLGLNPDGTVQVPGMPLQAGWYTGSVTPGEAGASVLLGHVDSTRTGPAVFYRLGALKPGDQVTVTRADGSTAAFRIDTVREYPKNSFPTLTIYGTHDALSHLRLITCGDWDPTSHSYRGNTVAFATLTGHHP